jgi:hypothetical protein
MTAPALVIHGADESLIHAEASKEIAATILGDEYHMNEGMGHGILLPSWPRLIELTGQHVETAASSKNKKVEGVHSSKVTQNSHLSSPSPIAIIRSTLTSADAYK